MYVIDTNVYIRAMRDEAFAPQLAEFEQAALPRLWVSAVVAFEIAGGFDDEQRARQVERRLLAPVRERSRVLVPSARTWASVARMDRAIRRKRGYAAKLRDRAFLNDMLLAASCREVGATLITANGADFALIDRAVGFRYLTGFPRP
ncbi:MAG: type II toxin-antitoxin system VapC family toxin [Gemmatimonadaceae bacterium]